MIGKASHQSLWVKSVCLKGAHYYIPVHWDFVRILIFYRKFFVMLFFYLFIWFWKNYYASQIYVIGLVYIFSLGCIADFKLLQVWVLLQLLGNLRLFSWRTDCCKSNLLTCLLSPKHSIFRARENKDLSVVFYWRMYFWLVLIASNYIKKKFTDFKTVTSDY